MNRLILCGILLLGGSSVGCTVSNEEPKKTIVVEMYIRECEVCGYDKMEGYYSYIDNTGYEECKECGHYIEIDNN